MDWYLKVWKDYAEFSGRARRKEYWMFSLFQILIILFGYSIIIGFAVSANFVLAIILAAFLGIYSLAAFIPSLAVSVRRLHDTGKSGWFLLIALIPIVGSFVLLVFLLTDSNWGDNQYGPNPKGISNRSYGSSYSSSGYDQKYHQPSYRPNPSPAYHSAENTRRTEHSAGKPETQFLGSEKYTFPVSLYQKNGNYAGKNYHIKGRRQGNYYEAVLGRKTADSDPDVLVNEDIVSRKHMAFIYRNSALSVKLISAKNATFLNHLQLELGQIYPLNPGDLIYIGHLEFQIMAV